MRSLRTFGVAALVGLAACGGSAGPREATAGQEAPAGGPVRTLEPPGAGGRPYVVTAVDYHFHDAHPSLPIALDQEIVFSSQSDNPHTVTFVDVDFDERLRPGERLEAGSASDLFPGPGRYPFYCRFHVEQGMAGVLIIE